MERIGYEELARRYAVMANRKISPNVDDQQAVYLMLAENGANIVNNIQDENIHDLPVETLKNQFVMLVSQTLANRHLGSLDIE